MGQTVTTDPTPRVLKKGQESVFDSPVTKVLRFLGQAIGADDPQSQILGMMNPMDVGAGGGLAGLVQKFIKAYHGSPHDFDQFSLSKIGTGEGAQAYGHGLYFAENPQTAKAYRDALKPGRGIDAADIAARILDGSGGDYQKAIQEVERRLANWGTPDTRPPMEGALDLLRQNAPVSGRMYEVAIHADPEQFLDWDKPLSQQPSNVQERVMPFLKDVNPEVIPQIKGRELLHQDGPMSPFLGPTRTPQAATEALKHAGIPGIKYLDQGSRSAGEGTRNYVVFDDQLIEILRKYGLLPPIGAAMAQQSQQEP